jgi:aminopeptidase
VQEAIIDKSSLETWADILVNHSLGGVGPQDRVMIKGERVGWPLIEIIERKVIEAGAIPDVYLIPPNNDRGRVWSANMGQYGTTEQLAKVPDWHQVRYSSMTKYIEVLGAEDPGSFSGLSSEQLGRLASTDKPYANIRLSKPWVITLYPTAGFAKTEGMAFEEYTDFVVSASIADPRLLLEAENKIAPIFSKAKSIQITTYYPNQHRELELSMDISVGGVELSHGLHNLPDGEVFTSPDANSTEGEIFVDLPAFYNGKEIRGIYLKFEKGNIVDYAAEHGFDQLKAIIETDKGARRLGEVALGMNPNMDKVLKHPLFVEKVGGTLHIAIGASYEHCYLQDRTAEEEKQRILELEEAGILNRSAQHVDIVVDFRPGGCGRSVKLDGLEIVIENGVWIPK